MQKFFFSVAFTFLLSQSTFSAEPEATTQPAAPILQVLTYTASDGGFAANSHLIVGKTEAVLIDAQFTLPEAEKVAQMILDSGKKLKAIYITHEHPDHYFGLEAILKEFPAEKFPDLKVKATQDVVGAMKKTAEGKFNYWKPMLKDALTNKVIFPEVTSERFFFVDGTRIYIQNFATAESESSTAFYIPSSKELITGDLVYSGVHLWLAEAKTDIAKWKDILTAFKQMNIRKIYPGHGSVADAKVLDADLEYLSRFEGITQKAASKEEALKEILSAYPDYRLPIIAQLSVDARMK